MEDIYKKKYFKYKQKYISIKNNLISNNHFYNVVSPYNTGYLKVDDLHTIYFEESGNPNGIPLLYIHGGPGAGIGNKYSKFIDTSKVRLIGFDQRGCGKSLPFAELKNNTTWDLINDIEKLRNHLNINKWNITGCSWGSTLALLYSIKHPNKILGLIVSGVCLLRQQEINWLYKKGGVSEIYPKEWDTFISIIPNNERNDLVKAFNTRLHSNDNNILKTAAKHWCHYEFSICNFLQDNNDKNNFNNFNKIIPMARIENHYFFNNGFLTYDNFILDNIHIIQNIPIIIVQARYDVVCPVDSAYRIHKALPKSKLYISPNGGHSRDDYPTNTLYIKAINEIINLSSSF